MQLPRAFSIQNSRTLLRVFGGLNETYGCSEAEYGQGINFSSRDYPALSTRLPRRRLSQMAEVNGLHHLNGLLVLHGTTLDYTPDDPARPAVHREDAVANSRKALVSMGTRILIWPDCLCFDTADGSLTPLGARWMLDWGMGIALIPCDAEGNTYHPSERGATLPQDPEDGALFLQCANPARPYSSAASLQKYNASRNAWDTIRLDCCRAEAPGLGAHFAKGDTVRLSVPDKWAAWLAERLDGSLDPAAGTAAPGQPSGTDKILYDCGEDYIVFPITMPENTLSFYGRSFLNPGGGYWWSLDEHKSEFAPEDGYPNTPFAVERLIPALDFVTECGNRVWGCSSAQNVIYACKLGDPTNWFSYRGIASDSYAVTVGSDGPFTGAATCMGYVVMFKESTLHKVYGSRPSDYQTATLRCRGVAKNAARSMCVINEVLYYLSPAGVMAWEGSLPGKVSVALDPDGIANASRAVGGQLDGRYYLHITRPGPDGSEQTRLLVFDTEKGVWHEESASALDMVSNGRQLILWDGEALWALDPSREPDWSEAPPESIEAGVRFEWISGDIGLDHPEEKYVSRVTIRLDAAPGTLVQAALSCDGGPWQGLTAAPVHSARQRIDLPLVPARCDTFRLRLWGTGAITLRAISLTLAGAKGKCVMRN